VAATPVAAAVDAERRFEFTLPPGWKSQPHGVPHSTALTRGNDSMTLSFYISNPGRWTVEWMMRMQDDAMKAELGEMKIETQEDLSAGAYPGVLRIHKKRDPSVAYALVTACVILPEGGVGIVAPVATPEMLQEVRAVISSVKPAVPPPGPESARFVAPLGYTRGILVDVRGFKLQDDEVRPDGRARKAFFTHSDERRFLTVLMKPASQDETAEDIRDDRISVLKAKAPEEVGLRSYADKDTASFEYFHETEVKGAGLHQRHVHRFWVSEGVRYEVHVSIVQYQDADQPWLDKFLSSLRLSK
jgi:hypothetical protein